MPQGQMASKAGRNVTETTKVKRTPPPTRMPRCRTGGTSLSVIDRNPTAVVSAVKKIGVRLFSSVAWTASFRSRPVRRRRA